MAKGHSAELKQQIVAFVGAGNSCRAAARQFDVSASFVVKLMKKTPVEVAEQVVSTDKPPEPSFDIANQVISAGDLADLLGVSKRSVSEFADKGIVIRLGRNQFSLQRSIKLYCEHLRVVAAGRGGDGTQELTTERARLAKEQADATALKNAQLRRELVAVADVERQWTQIMMRVRNEFLAVVSRVRQTLPHLTHFDVEQLDREIRGVLESCSSNDDGVAGVDAGGMGQPATAAEAAAL